MNFLPFMLPWTFCLACWQELSALHVDMNFLPCMLTWTFCLACWHDLPCMLPWTGKFFMHVKFITYKYLTFMRKNWVMKWKFRVVILLVKQMFIPIKFIPCKLLCVDHSNNMFVFLCYFHDITQEQLTCWQCTLHVMLWLSLMQPVVCLMVTSKM